MRHGLIIFLFGLSAAISGCSNGYTVDPAQYRTQRLAVSERPVQSAPTARRSQGRPVDVAGAADSEIVGTTGRSNDEMRPWPKRDTPEWKRLQAEEAERERRIGEMLRSGVCRAC
jgi:hypothetical protein